MNQPVNHINNDEFREGITSGDNRLLAQLIDKLYPSVTKYLKQMGASPDESEEIFYIAITALWEKGRWNGFESGFKFYPFLLEVCKHQWYNLLRGKKKHDKEVTPEHLTLLSLDPNIQELLELVEWRAKLYNYLAYLGDPCQALLKLWMEEGLNFEEIAQKMDYKNAETARQKKHKCLDRLRKIIGDSLNH